MAGPANLGQGRERRALDRPRAALGDRQHPGAPVALLRLLRARPDHDRAGAGGEVAAELAGPGHDVRAIRDATREQVLEEVADRGFGRPRGRLGPIDLEADQVRHQAQQRGRRRFTARAVAELSDRQLGHAQLDALRPSLAGHHGALVLARLAGHREHAAARVEHDHAGIERPPGRARHRRKTGARLDRLRDLVQRLQERAATGGRHARAAGLACGLCHHAYWS
jgi:hypothetical protein